VESAVLHISNESQPGDVQLYYSKKTDKLYEEIALVSVYNGGQKPQKLIDAFKAKGKTENADAAINVNLNITTKGQTLSGITIKYTK
jgi:hypothetical protein